MIVFKHFVKKKKRKLLVCLIVFISFFYHIDSFSQTVIFSDDFETDKGWTLTGEFERGTPGGLGGDHGYTDPSSAYSGSNVLGVDLSGLGTYPGDYENNLNYEDYAAVSPSFNCSAYDYITLSFQRWLNVEQDSYDNAYIEVTNDGGSNWNVVWENDGTTIEENAWSLNTVNISAYAAGETNVQVRFLIGSTDGSWQYCGWNIDDLEITGQTVIWSEDFSTSADGATTGTGSPAIATWTADGKTGGNGVDVQSNQLNGSNSYLQSTWTIDAGNLIEIGGYTDVSISVDISETGNLEGVDYIQLQYSVDGGAWTDFATNGYINNDFTSAVASQTGLSGNTLQIQIIMYNNATNENYFADNIIVIGTPTSASGTGTNYYSYQSGNWNDISTWTHDPGGTTQNATDIPNSGDIVTILNSRTVTLSTDVDTSDLDITIREGGIIDQSTYQFTAGLSALRGSGTFKLASVNFPTVITNDFVNTDGGTTEYNNTSNFTLPATQSTYYHLTINANGVIATQLSNLTLNGDLYVKDGTYRINDNSATTKLNLTINGDILVDNGAAISVGNGSTNTVTNPVGIATSSTPPYIEYYEQFHRLVIYGDFTNNGTVRFTNLDYPVYDAFPPLGSGSTSGAASVYFMGETDNNLTCNGTTDFYNLILDKGIDKTYKLTVSSSSYPYFRLFGANSSGGDETNASAENPNIKKALWIRTGTLELTGLVIIPSLTEGVDCSSDPNSDYYIPSNGALVLSGSEVIVLSTADTYEEINLAYNVSVPDDASCGVATGSCTSFSILGLLQIDNGYLSTRESGGFITWSDASGQLEINGGIVDAKQFRSSGGGGGLASYHQSGGNLYLRGRFQRTPTAYSSISDLKDFSTSTLNTTRVTDGLNGDYATFNINETSNVFSMSGGTISIYDVCGINAGQRGAFEVFSDVINNNVTGGTLEILPVTGSETDGAEFIIESTADIGNLTINRLSSSSVVTLNTYDLTVLNDFTLTSGEFDANDLDVNIGGDMYVENGTVYTPGTNSTNFNGTGDQTLTVNLASTLAFKKLKIDKTAGTTLILTGSQSTISVEDSLSIIEGALDDGGKTIDFITSATSTTSYLYNSGVHTGTGAISLSDDDPQVITGDGTGIFENLELNNTDVSTNPVSLNADITINGTLTFSQDKLFNIGTNNLNFGPSASIVNAGTNRFIQTSGAAGDGGVTKEYTSTATSFTFPFGTASTGHAAAEYTPATLSFETNPTTFGSITINPVGYEHPNTTNKGRSLTYYWRVRSTGFTLGSAVINHTYIYSENDVVTGGDVAETGYVAACYDNSIYSWSKVTSADVDETNNIIGGTGTAYQVLSYIEGEFTAGDDDALDPFGTPTVYYSRQSGLWSDVATWSLTDHTTDDPPATVPGANDIVIIGGQDSVYLDRDRTWYYNTDNVDPRSCATLKIEAGSAMDIGYNTNSSFSIVLNHENGNGNFRLTTSSDDESTYVFPSGDFSDFNINLGTTELYSTNPNAGTTYWLPNGTSSYGNLIISPLGGSNIIFPNHDVLIYGNLITRGENSLSWFCPTWNSDYPTAPTTRVAKTVTINGDFRIEGGAFVWYGNQNNAADFVVYGDLVVYEDAGIQDYAQANDQSISIGGDLINNSLAPGGGNNAYRGCDFDDIPLTFFGDGTNYITNDDPSATTYTNIESITVNKGSSQADSLVVDITGTFNTPTNDWLTLTNGTFKYLRDANLNITTNSTFTIPSTSGLYIDATGRNIFLANDNVNNNDVYLNGKLTIIDGSVYIGETGAPNNNNDIEYSGGGDSEIDIQGGSLTVNGQIRRNASTTAGVLMYNQSGGDVTINGRNTLTSNAKLEILNAGSEFNMSGGTLTIVRGGGGGTYGDLYLRPETSSVTGGEIIFSPGGAGDQDYTLDATIPLWDLTINGDGGDDANVELLVSSLEIDNDLTLQTTTSILDANINFDIPITINGDFENNGTYTHRNNITTFNGGTQSILGTSSINFYNLVVNPVTSLTLSKDATIQNDLTLSGGTLICGDYSVYCQGDVANNATYTDNSTGLVLNGSSMQYVSGTGTWGQLELDNSSGARLSNNISLQSDFLLTNGIFDINQYLLTLGVNSDIVGENYSNAKMITSDGVYSNVGVRKYYSVYSGAFQTDTIPIGTSGKYTPVYLSYTDNANVGYIRINNINDNHPGVFDADNVLDYYWEVESSGISGFNGSLVLNYDEGDVQVTGSNTEADYIAAGLLLPGTSWTKAAPGAGTDNVDESNNTITFSFSVASSLSGEFTAGIDAALPDDVPEFTSIDDGDWSDASNWQQTGGDAYSLTGAPNGFIITVDSDDEITTDINYASAYRIMINGTLKVLSSTYGHNLGTVSGSGTLYLESGTFPAGKFTDFLDCSNGATLEYGGSSDYTIIADLYSSIPNLHFTGSGTRTLPNKDLTICTQLLIDGPTVDNSINNRQLTIEGTFERYNTGAFLSGTGSGATVSFAGTSAQTIGGTLGDFTGTNAFNNLEINNSSGLTLNSSAEIEISGNLLLTDGVINTSSGNSFTITNTDISCVTPDGGSSASYIDGPLTKTIIQGDNFSFPVGKGSVVGNKINLSSTQTGTILWTVEYFNPNSTSGNMTSPLTYVNNDDYWTVTASSGDEAIINLDWDATSDLTPLMTENGLSDMRVAEYITGTSNWEELTSTASGDNNNGTVSTLSRITIPAGGSVDFTTACINVVKPRAQFSPTGAVCGSDGIPVSFTYSGSIPFDYTLDYTIDGVPQTQISITSADVPYTLPTVSAGTYQLTSFTYYNGAETGVVDPTEVEVYENPTTASAGTDQSLCGATSATLNGNTPAVGTGLWTIEDGTGGTVVTPTSPTSDFNGTNGSTYTLRWTITNGGCESYDEVVIDFPLLPVQPDAFTESSSEVCQGQTGVVYTVPNDPTVTYSWDYSGTGVTINGTGNSVTLDFDASATDGTLSVDATNGCGTSSDRTIDITVNPIPTISLDDPNVQVCQGGTSVDLSYTSVTGNPDQYSIDFDATAETAGFSDVTNASLPASPISITVPGSAATATYNADVTVINSTPGCTSIDYAITIEVYAISNPTITGTDSTCVGSSLSYTTESGMNNYVWTVDGTYGTITSGSGTNSITVNWTDFTPYGSPTTISVTYDDSGCIPASAGAMDIMILKVPETGPQNHIKDTW